MLFILQKTVKSLQNHLAEFLEELMSGELVEALTPGAITHARAKLKHTAFIELNQQSVLPTMYGGEAKVEIQTWHGHRLLGVDSSSARLPNSAELREQFSVVEVSNQLGSSGVGYPEGRMFGPRRFAQSDGLGRAAGTQPPREVDLAIEQRKQSAFRAFQENSWWVRYWTW